MYGTPRFFLLGLEARRAYQTRHTAATLWLAAGENPEWIARQLGHSNTEMLFRVYSRYVPDVTRRDGYSSLSYLKHYPFDEIKIDKSFISQLNGGAYDEAIIQAVITIANAIDANVVAEGIESDEQLAILRQLGCTTGQGFFFSRPLPESHWWQLLFSEKKFA